MARPTKPKDMKPKAEGESTPAALPSGGGGGMGLDIKFIVTILAIVLSTVIGSAASVYFLAPIALGPALSSVAPADHHGGEDGHAAGDEDAIGLNLELDEFMVNLKPDPNLGGNQYLRAKLSMSVYVPNEQNCYQMHHTASLPAIVDDTMDEGNGYIVGAAVPVPSAVNRTELASGGGGAEVDPTVACLESFKVNMAKYIPTMRDVINAALMKRTAGTLSTLEGQEALKDEIKEEINLFMDSGYEIARVNFEDFIIQR